MAPDASDGLPPTCPRCGAVGAVDGLDLVCRGCGLRWPRTGPPGAAGAAPMASDPAGSATPQGLREDTAARLVGKQFHEFRILSRIGSGGFGIVYRAHDEQMDRDVALKVLPPRLARRGPEFIERFLREARSAAKLQHPNIVTIYQVRPYKETFYIVMELVDGGTAGDLLASQGRLAPHQATRIVWSVADALDHAHRRFVIHRDLKPANILLTRGGTVKVSDFGVARDVLQAEDLAAAGVGTTLYMAPEQIEGGAVTAATDLYALGVTYFVLLTGRPPFDAADQAALVKQVLGEPPTDPRRFVADLGAGVHWFLQKALAKDPRERYPTAETFTEALGHLEFG
jgi:serine/threonine-protein kinase